MRFGRKINPGSLFRAAGHTAFGLWLAASSLLAQERPPAGERSPMPRTRSDQQIDEILRQLDALRRQVEALRGAGAQQPSQQPEQRPAEQSSSPMPAPAPGLPDEWASALRWRSIGPAGMGGRITDISVFEADPCVYFVATASGGLLKTENNGVTFTHLFDREATVSLGAVCVAPSNRNIVWVGTGENNPRNSVSYGDGVYKSTDGGKTWTNMGLKKSFQIGRIVIHPQNPDIVYVGAMGRLYGPNEERGLFKTTDGGATWEQILYVNDTTGVIDIAMHPAQPDTLIACTWEVQRDGFDSHVGHPPVAEGYDSYDPVKKWGPGSGLYKTTDGGRTWKRLNESGASGLPTCNLGRMDVEYYRKDPNIVFAIIDCEKIGMGTPPNRVYLGIQGRNVERGAQITQVTAKGPAEKAGLKPGDVIKAVTFPAPKEGEAGEKKPIENYAALARITRGRAAGDKLVLEVLRGDKTEEITVVLEERTLSALLEAGGGGGLQGSGYLGIQGEDAEGGVRLTQVVEGGPAERAGLRAGDLLKSLNQEPLANYEQFTELLRARQPGDKIGLAVLRNDKLLEVEAVLGERPQSFAGRGGGRTMPLAQWLGILAEEAEGVVRVARVLDDRPGAKAGLEAGDRLVEVDGVKIADVPQLIQLLGDRKDGEKVTFKIERGEEGKREIKDLAASLEAVSGAARTRPWTYMYAGQQPNIQDQQGPNSHEYGGVYKSTDGGETWTRINSLNPRPMYFSQIRVDPSDEHHVYVLGVSLHRSRDGGKTFTADGGRGVHADHHALWIDPRDGRHMVLGTDGGFYVTYDRMNTWEHLNHLAIGQFYHVTVDSRHPYRVYGGLQDNGSWGGPSLALSGSGPITEDWFNVGGGDGFVCRVDPFDPDIVYFESQNGAMARRNLRTGERSSISPRAQRGQRFRFNWNTPFIVSSHNAGIFYCAGNYVFRSVKRGDDLKIISPEITRTGRGTATALAESPRNPDVLWAGTDDGALWVTRDGGVNWTNVSENLGLPGPRWVATLEASRFAEGRCYAAFDAHRSDDDEPYLLVTEDFGQTWKSIRANLPTGSSRCLREDPQNPDLLFCGTEFACWASINRGAHWTKINNNLPTVAIHELAIHPTINEMAAATHGRSIWVVDITPLRQMTPARIIADAHLYAPNTVIRWRQEPARGIAGGSKHFRGENPPRAAQICYSLAKKPEHINLKILDHAGTVVRELTAKSEPGLHLIAWDLQRVPPRPAGPPQRRDRAAGAQGEVAGQPAPGGEAGSRRVGGQEGPRVQGIAPPGMYRVVLNVDGRELVQSLKIELDPTLPSGAVLVDAEEAGGEEEEEEEHDEPRPPRFLDD